MGEYSKYISELRRSVPTPDSLVDPDGKVRSGRAVRAQKAQPGFRPAVFQPVHIDILQCVFLYNMHFKP